MQDINTLQSSDSSDEGAQAWAIPFADMMTLLLTLFILLLVILKESEKFVDRQINLLLQETYEQLDDKIKNEDVSIERVTKGIQITLRGNLFQSMKANVYIRAEGKNDHHKIEGIFKAFAKALNDSLKTDSRNNNLIPSTKGVL